MRNSLVAALVACADEQLQEQARRFLAGLSADELQFIAEFLGAYILESQSRGRSRTERAERIARFQQARADRELKMILVREYLCRSGVPHLSMTAGVD